MLRYLAVLAVVLACFTGDVSPVTDQEFQEMQTQLVDLQKLVEKMTLKIEHQNSEIKRQASENNHQAVIIKQLQSRLDEKFDEIHMEDLVQNTTIEERVALLELQMMDVQEDVTGLDEDVGFLFDEQVIQDERLFSLEEDSDQLKEDVDGLQDTTVALEFRVTELEENGGSDGNSSISELEVRVETLEGTAADHETRITSAEGDVEALEESSADHETRLTAAEENIQGLQVTDINHDARITALEENGGGGGSQNETIAFHAVLTTSSTIPDETVVEFDEILLNQGNGYDSTTGVFTVPSGGDGTYYFSTYLLVQAGEYGLFDFRLNDAVICTASADMNTNGASDSVQSGCSAVVSVVEGDEVKLVLRQYTDNTPLYGSATYYYTGFNGFRI